LFSLLTPAEKYAAALRLRDLLSCETWIKGNHEAPNAMNQASYCLIGSACVALSGRDRIGRDDAVSDYEEVAGEFIAQACPEFTRTKRSFGPSMNITNWNDDLDRT
jgi:hypothetical protein